jgi:hypothetical protein
LKALSDTINNDASKVAPTLLKAIKIYQTNKLQSDSATATMAMADSGAQVGIGGKHVLRYLIGPIEYLDKVMPVLAGFDNARSNVITLIGMAYALFPTVNMDNSITCHLFLIYITKEECRDLLIVPTSQCEDNGGVTIFGTGHHTDVYIQSREGTIEKHSLDGQVSAMGSGSDRGLTKLVRRTACTSCQLSIHLTQH